MMSGMDVLAYCSFHSHAKQSDRLFALHLHLRLRLRLDQRLRASAELDS